MDSIDFETKFQSLQKILESDEEKCNEFIEKPTVKESYNFACKLVGNLDEKMYYKRVKEVIASQDDNDVHSSDSPEDSCDVG